jgi:PAS domain S-box-containing protein
VCRELHISERDGGLDNLLDVFFRFPPTDEASPEFVRSVLNFARLPILAVDKRARVMFANLQGEELLLRLKAERKGGRRKKADRFPSNLGRSIGTCLKEGRAMSVPEYGVRGLLGGTHAVLLCPGEVAGRQTAFVVLRPPQSTGTGTLESALDELLESFDAPVGIVDSDIRFLKFNRRYISTFNLHPTETIGARITDVNPSAQARILESQVRHLMTERRIRNSKADRLTTSKRGVVVTAISAWPLCDGSDSCAGLVAMIRPVPATALGPVMDETGVHVFGQAAAMMGPPMYLTHLDGTILLANVGGKVMLTDGGEADQQDLKQAVPWRHPEIIGKLYDDIMGGSEYSAILTEVETPGGTGVFRIAAYAIKEIGDITSQVLIHLVDVTDTEQMRNLLTSTVRNLATEKAILDKVIGDLPVGYAVVDRDLNILRVSESVPKRFGLPLDYFIGRKVKEVDPSTTESGIAGCIRAAIDRVQEIRLPRLPYRIPNVNQDALISLTFSPIEVGGKPACLVSVESLTEKEHLEAEAARKAGLHNAVFDWVGDGVAVLDPAGVILDVNPVVVRMLGKDKREIIGRLEDEIIAVEERDLLRDFRLRAMTSRKPVNTGCLKLTRKLGEGSIFTDITWVPSLGPDGNLESITVIIRFLTAVKDLERQLEAYTKNLERLVGDRTKELTSANALLEETVEKLASMARSGMVLSSLKDTESVMASFLKEASQVLGADFVSIALIETGNGTSKTTYYSTGIVPPGDKIPSDIVEAGLARLTIGEISEEVSQPEANVLTTGFAFSDHRGLLLAWKHEGEFSNIDRNLSRLLCTQLGFSLPITRYVTDLRRERDRSQALRRIGFRVAGTSSVPSAIRMVAEELSYVMSVDRFFWLVSKSDDDMWVREIYRAGGVPTRDRVHLESRRSDCLRPVLKACHNSHRLFCERLPHLAKGYERGSEPNHGSELCPFAEEGERGELVRCMKGLLAGLGMLRKDGGSLVVAPVTLSPESWGMLCGYKDAGGVFSGEDACFICLAAATVGHMWEAADAASNIRRLTTAGETVSELAHDLKYPLMKIRDSIGAISCCTPTEAHLDPAISGIGEQVESLTMLAQELIDLSNAGSRKYELLDVDELLEKCLSLTSADSESRSVKVKKQIVSALPPVFANRKDVKTVLLNLLANCIDAAGTDGFVSVDVAQGKSPKGVECVRLTIRDSGPGVPRSQITRIFDPFYTRREGGSGLGLFSAKKRARANGGDVICEIGPDGKSRFVVWLPLASG